MPSTIDALEGEAMKLPPDERVALCERLLLSVAPARPLHPDWDAEIARRVEDMDAGRTRFISADDALRQLDAHILKRRPA